MEKKKKEKKLLIALVSILLIACIGIISYIGYKEFLSTKNVVGVNTYLVNGQSKKLEKGDELVINYWNTKNQTLNNKKISGMVSTYNGIKVGSSKEEVIKKFHLNRKNTKYECEIPDPQDDGCTSIVSGKYSKKIFKSDYLDCNLIFGYKDGKMLNYKEVNDISQKIVEPLDVTLYAVDISGFEDDEFVKKGKVIQFSIHNY